jgi:uncharacterized protein (TIGR04255 family)
VAIQYQNAPIIEALIDLRVDLPAGVSLGDLERLHEQVSHLYPSKRTRFLLQRTLNPGADPALTSTQGPIGFAFQSADGRQICQVRLDGFSFSRLRPYGNWIELRTEARRLWDIYRSAVNPGIIRRVAVRYINQIDIPHLRIDYKEYFRTAPEVSPALPQAMSGLFMQLLFPQPAYDGMLVLTQTVVPPPRPDMQSVILDLDAFRDEPALTSDDQIWDLLETLRNTKNTFFEGSITDKTRELFGATKEY